jgi:chemotaxis protein CheD
MSQFRGANSLPPLEPPYDRVTRYIDPHTGMVTAKLVPGQLFVGGARDCITTVVGSCVTVCMHDARARCGGMLQFLLPFTVPGTLPARAQGGFDAPERLAFLALETLVTGLESRGARRGTLRTKLFGAARVDPLLADSSRDTIHRVRSYLRTERIVEDGADTGLLQARKIVFHPGEGRVLIKKLGELANDTLPRREREYYERVMARAGAAPVNG